MQNLTAIRTAPSQFSVRGSLRIETGDTIEVRRPSDDALLDTLLVVGEPCSYGWREGMVRVREVGGRHDGNEFGAHYALGR